MRRQGTVVEEQYEMINKLLNLNEPNTLSHSACLLRDAEIRLTWQRVVVMIDDKISKGKTSSNSVGVVDYALESPAIPAFLISNNLFINLF